MIPVLVAALRVSRRDALRAKGRTALIMVMIGLPVLLITAVLTSNATTDVSPRERLDSVLGSADARLVTLPLRTPVKQDLSAEYVRQPKAPRPDRQWTPAEIGRLIHGRLLRYQQNATEVRVNGGYDRVEVLEVDLRDPMTRGMRTLVEGRFAAAVGEVAVSPALTDLGVRVGDTLAVTRQDRPLRVVGVVQNPNRPGRAELVGLPESVLGHQNDGNSSGWLADTSAPVLRADVRRLNQAGLAVYSRELIERAPRGGADDWRGFGLSIGPPEERLIGLGVGVVIVVAETALLAGPAFAVGLRRRRRELAVLAAQGVSGRQLKAVVLADGLVLGGAAVLVGVVLGVLTGMAVQSAGARWMDWTQGPLDVPWLQVLATAALGVVSGLTAALVPAVQASRQSPAQVLTGRAGVDPPGRAGRPVLGTVLVVLGAGGCFVAARRDQLAVSVAAVVLGLGLIALMPLVIRSTGRLAGRLPLPLRLAVRDASRHRVRTASAAGAVMAATMTAVALGLFAASSAAQREAGRTSLVPLDTLTVGVRVSQSDEHWSRLREETERLLPGTPTVPGMVATNHRGEELDLRPARADRQCTGGQRCRPVWEWPVVVGDEKLLRLLLRRDDQRAAAALARGDAVALGPELVHDGTIELAVGVLGADSFGGGQVRTLALPAVVATPAEAAQSGVLIGESALKAAGLRTAERRLYAAGVTADRDSLWRALDAVSAGVYVDVERRWDEDTVPVLFLMLGAAMVLVLGGTFAATGLAAADMRQDLDTMSAVGAPPRVRRFVVAAQAAYISGLGAAVGLAGGTVAGAAMIRAGRNAGGLGWRPSEPEIFDIPWVFLAALVVGLPLLAALVAGAFTRTRQARTRRVG